MYGALDIGGTKIAGAVVDAKGDLLVRAERPTPAHGRAEAVMAAVTAVMNDLSAHAVWPLVSCLGIGSAGPVDTVAGTVSPVNIAAWRGFPLVAEVASHPALPTGIRPVLVGDAVAMTAAEHWKGAARGVANALCMVVSTGVGGGLVLDGRLHTGITGNAGHIGHISVDLNGEHCPCGSRGCVELLASGTAIARRALASGWLPPAGAEPTAAHVADSALNGDSIALAVFDQAAQALAASIAATATLVELDVVVIGGGVAQAEDLLFAPLRRHLATYAALSFTHGLDVRPSQFALDSGLIGAAAVASAVLGVLPAEARTPVDELRSERASDLQSARARRKSTGMSRGQDSSPVAH
ncbi:ROK family protein [Streptomyces sp. BH104]|uniref:ROK family protein n=1 Tax=Streptomyces sp. BH104 TaxID=3410407 RepID=UPI003BB5581D